MKKSSKSIKEDIQAEYDFSHGVRGKYAQDFEQGVNIVILSPEVTQKGEYSEADQD